MCLKVVDTFRCYLVAYQSTAKLPTIASWLVKAAKDPAFNIHPHALNGVFVLGQGFIVSPSLGMFMMDRTTNVVNVPGGLNDWVLAEQQSGSLYALFFVLNFLQCGINIRHYFHGVLDTFTVVSG